MSHAQQGWHHSGADCYSPFHTCLLTSCIPCVTYGRIAHRLRYGSLTQYSPFNSSCCGYAALSFLGLQWVMQAMQRSALRQNYKIKGNSCSDIACACCCCCCDLVQQDKEARHRENEGQELVMLEPEQAVDKMVYDGKYSRYPSNS